MKKDIIYYTDFHVDPKIQEICLKQLINSFWDIGRNGEGRIIAVSLNKLIPDWPGANFIHQNIVVEGERSNTMMTRQIVKALEHSTSDYIFMCEHDVLYAPEHFDFVPPKDNVFYYDLNNWRWEYPKDRIINYDQLTSLSMMCCNRLWALLHYRKRLKRIIDSGWDKKDGIGNLQPVWIRALGYEPGTKRRRIGGFSDDVSERWRSAKPNVDIRHSMTLSNPKTHLKDFKHAPTGFREETLDFLKPTWDLKKLFNVD